MPCQPEYPHHWTHPWWAYRRKNRRSLQSARPDISGGVCPCRTLYSHPQTLPSAYRAGVWTACLHSTLFSDGTEHKWVPHTFHLPKRTLFLVGISPLIPPINLFWVWQNDWLGWAATAYKRTKSKAKNGVLAGNQTRKNAVSVLWCVFRCVEPYSMEMKCTSIAQICKGDFPSFVVN